MSNAIKLAVIFAALCSWSLAQTYSFTVRHDHDPWGACRGALTISAEGIQFESEKEEHSMHWGWIDIQTVDRFSPQKFSVVTYKDQSWVAGRDRPFDFTLLDGAGLTDEAWNLLSANTGRPLVDRTARSVDGALYEVAVKHLHTMGGCEGILRFTQEWIVFESNRKKDTRSWRRGSDVTGIWSAGAFDLDIVALEREGGDLSGTRRFRFQLKEPLDQDFYTRLRRELLPPR